MRKVSIILVLVLLVTMIFEVSAQESISNLFREAIKLTLNQHESGGFESDYEVDTYSFTAPEAGYYAFRGKADMQIRGHLYDSNYQFMYGGNNLSSGNAFFVAAYLETNQTVYIRVDSLSRERQNYTIVAAKDSMPFNRLVLSRSSITEYVDPGTRTTISVPVYFYIGNTRVSHVEATYPHMMKVSASGNIRGQAAFNLLTNNLEIDVYDISDARITLSIGPSMSTTISIKTLHKSGEPSVPTKPDQEDKDIEKPDPEPDPPVLPEEPERKAQIHSGDVNLNNIVDMNDVISLLDPITLSRFTQEQFRIADVTNNGAVDANDALMILRRVSGARR
jgi:hypothetical protein